MQNVKEKIDNIGKILRKLHKQFLENERQLAEGKLGRTLGPLDFFNLLTQDADFKWLQPFSALVIDVDDYPSNEQPLTDADFVAAKEQIERVLFNAESPIAKRYQNYVDNDAEFAFLHVELDKLLGQK
jgi:hypothetical protein